MSNPVSDRLTSWQFDADGADTNLPVAGTSIGLGTAGDLAGELRRIKSELRGESLNKGWEVWKGITNLAATGPIAFTYATTATFTVNDNLLARGVAITGRRVRAILSGSTIYGTITAASFSAPNTVVSVAWDGNGALNATLSDVNFGLEPNASSAQVTFSAFKTVDESLASSILLQNDNELFLNSVGVGFYDLNIAAFYTSAVTAGIVFFLSLPGASTCFWQAFTSGASSNVFTGTQLIALQGADATVLGVRFFGSVVISSFGDVHLQWCQQNGDPTATVVVAGSSLTMRKLR